MKWIKGTHSVLFLLVLLTLFPKKPLAQSSNELIFVIRVDDILSRNTSILPRSIQPFEEVVEARGGKITWGVIPHRLIETPNLDGVLAEELIASMADGHEVSLHGYIHICQLCNQSSHEMYCSTQARAFSYDDQLDLIRKGLDLLDEKLGVRPVSFIPPGHVSDQVTNQVLHDAGFRYLSTATNRGPVTDSLYNLPINGEYTWGITESNYQGNLTYALGQIRAAANSTGIYALMMHDPFIRSGYQNGLTLAWTGELLDSLNLEYGDRIQYKTLSEAGDLITGQVSVSVEDQVTSLPEEFILYPNYPNPFNATTQVPFSLSSASHVTIEIYSILGQRVAVIADGFYPAGYHTVSFTGDQLSTGLYLYRMTAAGITRTRVMNLLK